jgi:hypothetical protein
MFRNLKCKNTILCELSFIIIPLLLIVAGFVALAVIPNDEIASIVLIICFILGGVSLVLNARHIFTIDFTLTNLRNWQKDRLSFETDINGLVAQEVEKAITARALKWGKEQQNPDGASLTLYKKTKTFNELLPAVHQKLIVYSLQNLTFEDYKVKLAQAQKENLKNISGEETAVALIFLCDRVEQSVLNCVREDCGYNEDEETVVIPLVYDGLTRQYYFNAFYEYNLFVKSTKNYLLDSIKKVVFGGKLPLENNDRFDYSNEISVWQDKTLGDLLGPCMFAVMMGISRVLYGKFSGRVDLTKWMMWGCVGCICAYLLAAFAPHPIFALIGCALCGFSVGVFWPGTLSHAAANIPLGGVSMFAILAVAGDIGCLSGPYVSGVIADAFGQDLRAAFVFATIFPIICLTVLCLQKRKKTKEETQN